MPTAESRRYPASIRRRRARETDSEFAPRGAKGARSLTIQCCPSRASDGSETAICAADPSARRASRRLTPRFPVRLVVARTNAAAAPKTRTRTISMTPPLDLDGGHAPADHVADHHHHERDQGEELTFLFLPERSDVVRVYRVEAPDHDERPAGEQVRRRAPHRGQRLDLAVELEALADHAGEVLQHLGEVRARLLLDRDRGHEERQVLGLDPVGEVGEGVAHLLAELDLVRDVAELGPDRIGQLLADHLQARRERVPGAQRPDQEVEGLGELRLEAVAPLALEPGELHPGQEADERADDREGELLEEHEAHEPAAYGEPDREHHEALRPHGEPGPVERELERLSEGQGLDDPVEQRAVLALGA